MHTYAHTHTHTHTYHIHTCTHTLAHTHTRVHVHAHTYTHIHTHKDGYSAIDIAAHSGHEDVVELLLDVKTDPELSDEQLLSCISTSKVTGTCYRGGSRLYTYVGIVQTCNMTMQNLSKSQKQ